MLTAEFRQAARRLYGDGKPVAEYRRRLAALLGMSEAGVKKLWYGECPISGPVARCLRLAQERETTGVRP